MNNSSNMFLYIEFHGADLPQNEIKTIWNNEDIYCSGKGELIYDFEDGKKIAKKRQCDYCNIRYELLENKKNLNDILLNFLNNQKENINYISNICPNINIKIHLCIYPDYEQYTFDLSKELIKLLATLDVEIGSTIIQLENFY